MPDADTLRRASLEDIDLIVPMVREYYALDHIAFDEATTRATLGELLQHPEYGCAWVIVESAATVGYLVLTFDFSLEFGGREAFIDELFIVESHRHRGVGTRALELAETACREWGFHALHLEVERANVQAQRLYRRLGFVDHDRYLLTKRLDLH